MRAQVKTLPRPSAPDPESEQDPHPRRRSARASAVPTAVVAERGFGPHLLYDGYGCPESLLSDLDGLYSLLDRLPDRIGMTKIMPPYVFRHGAEGRPGGGLSGFVLIAESHISVHSFPGLGFVNADVFSCESFDPRAVVEALGEAFHPARAEWKLIDRGREFPKNIGHSRAAVLHDRLEIARDLGLGASS